MTLQSAYLDFIAAKAVAAPKQGFALEIGAVNPLLHRHQPVLVKWLVEGGRRALFANFGLGKTMIQLETMRLIAEAVHSRNGGTWPACLIVIPLTVVTEFKRDAGKLGIEVLFVRTTAEIEAALASGFRGLFLTNYESVREGKIDTSILTAVSLDEASCLRGFGGTKTFREFMALLAGDDRRQGERKQQGRPGGIPYRFVATATPSPNEYIELLAYAAFLGVMDVGQAKTRFFKRNSEKADQLTIHPHKTDEFWTWINSWGAFVQRPSELCGCSCHAGKILPGGHSGASASSDGCPEPSVTVPGDANASAAASGLPPQTTCSQGGSSAAGASAPATEPRTLPPGAAGKACGDGSCATGAIMADEESSSASGGTTSPPSSATWDNRLPAQHSTGSTTTGTTSRETAAGPTEGSRHETPGATCSSATTDGSNPSPHGPKNSEPITSRSIPGTAPDGLPSECSPSSCAQCKRYDEGYELPPLDVRWHEVPSDHSKAGEEKSGQGKLLKTDAIGVVDASREKRDTIDTRVAKMLEIIQGEGSGAGQQWVVWCDLNDEQKAAKLALESIGLTVASIEGATPPEERARILEEWRDRKRDVILSKPVVLGSGMNLQQCNRAIYLGIGFKFNDWVQSLHRVQRFLQTRQVRIDLIYSEAERSVKDVLLGKWKRHEAMCARMSEIIRTYGLGLEGARDVLQRSAEDGGGAVCEEGPPVGATATGYMSTPSWKVWRNDTVIQTGRLPENSVGLIVTSVPFSTQYEYTPSYNDFGHSDDNDHFFRQMDFLSPELLRVLKPGRKLYVHVKDRSRPGGLEGVGFQTVDPFHADCIAHYRRHGFYYMGMITVETDVVRENNQTYRLGWSEKCKDGSRMSVGMPEYVLIFRKAPSDNSDGYADEPVVHDKADYTRGRWQTDAHAKWRSSGNRLPTPEEFRGLDAKGIYRKWREASTSTVYDYEAHVAIAEDLGAANSLPPGFALLPPHAWHPEVWSDVARMRTLNGEQAAKGREMHLCPLQFDIVDRIIEFDSNPGDVVYDPFGGLMTVPLRAAMKGRVGWASELNPGYFADGVRILREHDASRSAPTLFDLLAAEEGGAEDEAEAA